MKRVLLASLVLTSALWGAAAHAATTINSGDLIKGPGDAVYYYGQNAKRYVFPNLKTYLSWYPDFSAVKSVTADDLAAIPIGGNVTYRPGVKLVKITTDPKTYAVSANGTLRWIQTEAVAQALYGTNWNTKVDDIADPFFINYKIGASITNASDFSPSAQTAAATDINTDKQLSGVPPVTTPTPTTTTTTPPTATTTTTVTVTTSTTPALNFTLSKPTAQLGDVETLTATYTGPDQLSKIELFFNGALIKTCTLIDSCSADAVIPQSGMQTSFAAEARATKLDTSVLTQDANVTIQTDGSSLVHVTIGQQTITSGQAASVIAAADASIAVQRIDISVNGSIVKGCADGSHLCQWSDYVSGAIGSIYPVFARVTDTLGRVYTSSVQNITIGTNDLPGVTVTPAKTTIYAGETVDVTVSATDNNGIASIDVMQGTTVLKHCDSAAPCTATTGPWSTAGTTLTFSGRATDTLGNVGTATALNNVAVITAP